MVLILALTLLISLSVHIILGNNLLAIYHFVMIWFNYIYVYLSFDKRNLATANEQQTNGPYYHSYERVLLNVWINFWKFDGNVEHNPIGNNFFSIGYYETPN